MQKLKYISSFKDRHGKTRWRFRRKGYYSVYLEGEFNSPKFHRSYAEAMENRLVVGESKVVSKSFSDLILRYLKSHQFKMTAKSTQTVYRRILDKFRLQYGDLPVKELQRRHIRRIMTTMEATPSSANRLLSLLSIMLDLALDLEWIKENHARTIKKLKYETRGHETWTESEMATYTNFYPSGSRERLAFTLYLYTGQRGSDVFLLSRGNIEGKYIKVTQQKTGTSISIPIHPKLQDELDLHKDKLVFMLTKYGKSFSKKGFQQWFVKTAKKAGIEGRSGHGLRKSAAAMLAEAGCTSLEIQSITGHKSLSEIENYTKGANQKLLASRAMGKLE